MGMPPSILSARVAAITAAGSLTRKGPRPSRPWNSPSGSSSTHCGGFSGAPGDGVSVADNETESGPRARARQARRWGVAEPEVFDGVIELAISRRNAQYYAWETGEVSNQFGFRLNSKLISRWAAR